MQPIRQFFVRWVKPHLTQKVPAPGALKPLRRDELVRATGGVGSTMGPNGTW